MTKGRIYKYCKLPNHEAKNYFFLFPNKAPKGWQIRSKAIEKELELRKEERYLRNEYEDNIAALMAKISPLPNTPPQVDLTFDMEGISFDMPPTKVFITQNNNQNNDINTDINIDALKSTIDSLDKYDLQKIKVFNIRESNKYTC